MFKGNKIYEILTPSGFQTFDGIQKLNKRGTVCIDLDCGNSLTCALNHNILTRNGWIPAKELSIFDKIFTNRGISTPTKISINFDELFEFFDPINVKGDSSYFSNNLISHNCQFLGSSGTLIAGWKLEQLATISTIPIMSRECLKKYEEPKEKHQYITICDVSRGKGLDYSAFSVIDVTSMPYKQVCVYRDNMITPIDYADKIFHICKSYNNAQCLVELNDIGGQVADSIFYDYDYEYVLSTMNAGRQGKRIVNGYGKGIERGIRTTKTVKATGCAILKLLIEQDKLLLNDRDTIAELSRFSRKNNSYEAEEGATDDLVMSLVLFAWLSDQEFFRDLTNINTLFSLKEKTEEQIQEELIPFGFYTDGVDDDDYRVEDPVVPNWVWINDQFDTY
jgi:hypothetical protein